MYNLKAVLMETNMKADVLRAWERRYHLPRPQRTAGGHRLYSQYDIEVIRWLRSRQEEGLSISHAVSLWRDLIQAGKNPLVEARFTSAAGLGTPLQSRENEIEVLRQAWVDASLGFDVARSEDVLFQAFAVFPVETVCTGILQKGIAQVGDLWYANRASLQQMYFASAQANRRLEALIASTPRPTFPQTILVGNPPGDRHTFPILILSLFMARRGYKVIYLGGDLPLEEMAETVHAIRPSVVVLSAQQLSSAASLRTTAALMSDQGCAVGYGGLIFNRLPGLRQQIDGVFLGETLEKAPDVIERLALGSLRLDVPKPPANPYRMVVEIFRSHRTQIEAAVLSNPQLARIMTEFIAEANFFFGNALLAALEFGDLATLQADLVWVEKLLEKRQMPVESVVVYLEAYSRALDKSIRTVSSPIVDWMKTYCAEKRKQGSSL
jgi:DNA-binding transcriptional MerR regulator/methylmalonyl-CoA mutase cobalamin-binding subunit